MIEVRYKCKCMGLETSLQLIERDAKREAAEWMEMIVTPAISYDHRTRSPYCRRPAMEYVKIPMDDATGAIGAKTKPN